MIEGERKHITVLFADLRNSMELHAASAAIGVATAQLYPTITLSASWPLQTATAGVLFDTSSFISNLTAGLTTPLFHGGALEAQRRAAIDAFDAQLGDYRQTVLQAFGQVADVLRALQHDARAAPRRAHGPDDVDGVVDARAGRLCGGLREALSSGASR